MERPISFVIRVVGYDQDRHMRGQIEHVPTGATGHFHDLAQVDAFIRSYLAAITPDDAPARTLTGGQVSSLFSFRRKQAQPAGDQPAEPTAEALVHPASGEPLLGTAAPDQPAVPAEALVHPATGEPLVSVEAADAAPALAAAAPAAPQPAGAALVLDQALAAMLEALDEYLDPYRPPQGSTRPAPIVSVVGLRERAVGLGGRRGIAMSGFFAAVELKGVRLDALIRFNLWADDLPGVESFIADLNAQLAASRDALWQAGFLRVALEATSSAEEVTALHTWRQYVDYRMLFEFRYADTDGAQSLIARIPIHSDPEVRDSPDRETTVVSDNMARWDNLEAPRLVVRGPFSVGRLSALSTFPGPAPSGPVTITRTFDGAAGPPADHPPPLAGFLAAVAAPDAPQRHARITFASLSDFLAALGATGDPLILGDWDADNIPDSYQPRSLAIEPAIQLPGTSDRLEIESAAFDHVAVVYLRAMRG